MKGYIGFSRTSTSIALIRIGPNFKTLLGQDWKEFSELLWDEVKEGALSIFQYKDIDRIAVFKKCGGYGFIGTLDEIIASCEASTDEDRKILKLIEETLKNGRNQMLG